MNRKELPTRIQWLISPILPWWFWLTIILFVISGLLLLVLSGLAGYIIHGS